jgi:hypothetical protein
VTYKQGCKYAALLGIPCLIFDVIARMPPFYHMAGIVMPLVIIGLNVLAWGAVIWSVGNVVESSRRSS